MMLRLQPYDITVTYKKRTQIPIGDTLSRAVTSTKERSEQKENPEIPEVTIHAVDHIAITPAKYRHFQDATANQMSELYQMILKGWPDPRKQTPHCVRDFWNFRDELGVTDVVIL